MDPITYQEEFQERLRLTGVPTHMHAGVIRYVMHGQEPGGFLMAILTNNFTQAVFKADQENLGALDAWARFLYWDIPAHLWGDRKSVLDWCDQGGYIGSYTREDRVL